MNADYPHNAFCVCGHWNVKHRQMELGERCEWCECREFKVQTRCGVVLTPDSEQEAYQRAMRGD